MYKLVPRYCLTGAWLNSGPEEQCTSLTLFSSCKTQLPAWSTKSVKMYLQLELSTISFYKPMNLKANSIQSHFQTRVPTAVYIFKNVV
eukprot:c9655_g1_i1 orf=1039-1302(-)